MQRIKIEELDYQQQEKLKNVLLKQKSIEYESAKLMHLIVILVWGAFVVISYQPMMKILKEYIDASYSFQILEKYSDYLSFIGLIWIISIILFLITENNKKNKEKDDFYIIYGYVEDKVRRVYNSNQRTEYFYIIDRKSIKVATSFFENFNYCTIPLNENRYLLSREQDDLIRKDITKYF